MLPFDVYRPRSYPPGPQWAQWGDRYLDRAFQGLSGEAYANLSQKRQGMMQFHKDHLDKQGLTNIDMNPPAPPPEPPRFQEEAPWPDKLYGSPSAEIPSYAAGPAEPEEPPPSGFKKAVSDAAVQAASMIGRGATEAATQTAAAYFGGGPLASTIASGAANILAPVATNAIVGGAKAVKNLVVQRGTAASYNPPGTAETGTQAEAPKKTLSYSRGHTTYVPPTGVDAGTQATVPGEMEQDPADVGTQYYGSDIEVDDQEMQNRVPKRSATVKTERKVKVKVEPPGTMQAPVKQELVRVKQERGRSSASSSSTRALPPLAEENEVETTSARFNNNTDMKFWEYDASANEMRSQLNFRFPEKSGDWAYKDRAQLISIIRGLIRKKQWVQGSTAAPSRGRSRSPPVNASPAIDPHDDDIQVGAASWDTNQDPAYWAQHSSNYIRQQLTAHYPEKRREFAFFKYRQQYIDYIVNLIREGKW